MQYQPTDYFEMRRTSRAIPWGSIEAAMECGHMRRQGGGRVLYSWLGLFVVRAGEWLITVWDDLKTHKDR